jgi:hypothetical protein
VLAAGLSTRNRASYGAGLADALLMQGARQDAVAAAMEVLPALEGGVTSMRCFVPQGRPACLPILVKVCGRRWTVEEDHESGKDQFGYDHAQVRLYIPVMRHLALGELGERAGSGRLISKDPIPRETWAGIGKTHVLASLSWTSQENRRARRGELPCSAGLRRSWRKVVVGIAESCRVPESFRVDRRRFSSESRILVVLRSLSSAMIRKTIRDATTFRRTDGNLPRSRRRSSSTGDPAVRRQFPATVTSDQAPGEPPSPAPSRQPAQGTPATTTPQPASRQPADSDFRQSLLVMAALAICAVTTASLRDTSPAPPQTTSADQEPPEDPGLIPFTVPEIKRLYILVHQTLHNTAHGLHWSWWKRRHQARARWYHHRTRLRDLKTYP